MKRKTVMKKRMKVHQMIFIIFTYLLKNRLPMIRFSPNTSFRTKTLVASTNTSSSKSRLLNGLYFLCVCMILLIRTMPNPFSSEYERILIDQDVQWNRIGELIQIERKGKSFFPSI